MSIRRAWSFLSCADRSCADSEGSRDGPEPTGIECARRAQATSAVRANGTCRSGAHFCVLRPRQAADRPQPEVRHGPSTDARARCRAERGRGDLPRLPATDGLSRRAELHQDAGTLAGGCPWNLGARAKRPRRRRPAPNSEGDDVRGHLAGARLPLLRSGAYGLLSNARNRAGGARAARLEGDATSRRRRRATSSSSGSSVRAIPRASRTMISTAFGIMDWRNPRSWR